MKKPENQGIDLIFNEIFLIGGPLWDPVSGFSFTKS